MIVIDSLVYVAIRIGRYAYVQFDAIKSRDTEESTSRRRDISRRYLDGPPLRDRRISTRRHRQRTETRRSRVDRWRERRATLRHRFDTRSNSIATIKASRRRSVARPRSVRWAPCRGHEVAARTIQRDHRGFSLIDRLRAIDELAQRSNRVRDYEFQDGSVSRGSQVVRRAHIRAQKVQ